MKLYMKVFQGMAALFGAAACAVLLAPSGQAAVPAGYLVQYQAHVENIGWQDPVADDTQAGTTGVGLRMEALRVSVDPSALPNAHICYAAHVQDIGWQSAVCDGQDAGTTGQSKRMEALTVSLSGAPGWDVCYSAHVQNIGWQPEVCDGAVAGTTGRGLRMEAIKIRLVHHVDTVQLGPTVTGKLFQDGGWSIQTTASIKEDRDAVTGQTLRAYLDANTHAWSQTITGFHGTSWITLGPKTFITPRVATGASLFSENKVPWQVDLDPGIAETDQPLSSAEVPINQGPGIHTDSAFNQ